MSCVSHVRVPHLSAQKPLHNNTTLHTSQISKVSAPTPKVRSSAFRRFGRREARRYRHPRPRLPTTANTTPINAIPNITPRTTHVPSTPAIARRPAPESIAGKTPITINNPIQTHRLSHRTDINTTLQNKAPLGPRATNHGPRPPPHFFTAPGNISSLPPVPVPPAGVNPFPVPEYFAGFPFALTTPFAPCAGGGNEEGFTYSGFKKK